MDKEIEKGLKNYVFEEIVPLIPWMTREEKINLVLGGLKAGGFNNKIEADGKFGFQGHFGLEQLLSTPRGENPDGIDLVITIFKNIGFNDALRVGGRVDDETRKAVENFRQFLKEGKRTKERSI